MGQDLNHNTLYQHPYDFKLWAGLDQQEDTRETHGAFVAALMQSLCVKRATMSFL